MLDLCFNDFRKKPKKWEKRFSQGSNSIIKVVKLSRSES